MKRIVLDTNVFLVSIGRKSKYHWIFKALLDSKYELIVTTPILCWNTMKSLANEQIKLPQKIHSNYCLAYQTLFKQQFTTIGI